MRKRYQRRGQRSTWRTELLYLSIALLEIIWMTPWFLVLAPGARSLSGIGLLIFVAVNVLAALLLVRLLGRYQANDGLTNVLFVGGVLLAVGIALRYVFPAGELENELPLFMTGKLFFPPALLLIALVALFWYQGLRVATLTITPARASFSLRLGIVFEIFAAVMPDPRVQRMILILLPGFFFTGLLASSLARTASLRINRETQRASFGGGWIAFVALIGGSLTLVGFVAALLVAGFQFEGILAALGKLITGAILIVFSVVEPFFRVLAEFIDAALRNLSRLQGGLMGNGLGGLLKNFNPDQDARTNLIFALTPFLCVLGGTLVTLIVMLIILRNRKKITLADGEERESMGTDAILASLRTTLQKGLDGLAGALAGLARFGADTGTLFTIRRLYARMAELAAARGYPRQTAQTPDEYAPSVVQAFPELEREVRLLTRAYVDVHYGEHPDNPDLVSEARQAVARMAEIAAQATK